MADLNAQLLALYRSAPQDWMETPPQQGWHRPLHTVFMCHKNSGVIIALPNSERIDMETKTKVASGQNVSIGSGSLPGLAPLPKVAYRSDIMLGELYREEDTGFEGIAQAIYFYRNSCERVELERYNKKLGMEQIVFDAKRLVHVPSGEKVDTKDPGGPDRGHPRRSTPKRR